MTSLPAVRTEAVSTTAAAAVPGDETPRTPHTPGTPYTPGSCHQNVRKACSDALKLLDDLSKVRATPYTASHYFTPYSASAPVEEAVVAGTSHPLESDFLVNAKALIFFKSTKGGFLAGWEHGTGIMISRLPPGATGTDRWSSPCFMTVNGFQFGLVAGMDRTQTLIAVMSDKGLDSIIANNGKVSFGMDFNLALWPLEKNNENKEWSFGADFAIVSTATGLMADVAFTSTGFRVDHKKNACCYSPGVTAAQILRGEVDPPTDAVNPLIEKINALTAQAARRSAAARATTGGPASAIADAEALAPGGGVATEPGYATYPAAGTGVGTTAMPTMSASTMGAPVPAAGYGTKVASTTQTEARTVGMEP
ncbi:hypothetical protein N2152v2_010460 [Parachlorella kessleri]